MKELFRILGDKIAAPLWEIERHVKAISLESKGNNQAIEWISDAIFEQNRIQGRELEEIKHSLKEISKKEVAK